MNRNTACSPSRRNLMKVVVSLGGLAAFDTLTSRVSAAGEEITIVTWETYHDDKWLNEWTVKSGVKVNAIRTGSNDETYAKLRSGAVVPDMIVIDIGSMPRFLNANLIVPVDPSKITNAANIASGLNFPGCTTIQGAVRGIPYNWGTQPLMFNTKTVLPRPTSWKVLWDKQYAGKVVLPDDAYNVFPMIALAIGARDPFNLTEAEFQKCGDALRDLRPQLRTLARGFDDETTIFASGDGDLGYCENISSVFGLQAQGKAFDYTFPNEGTPAWVDCSVLTPAGQSRKIVYDFINEMLTPQWQARFIQSSVNNGILDLPAATAAGVPQDILNKTNIPNETDPTFWKKMSFFQNPENVDRRLEIWNAFKAGTL